MGEAVAASVGAGVPGLAQGARPGAAGGTAGRRAAGGREEHRDRDGQSLTMGRARPMTVHSMDGSLLRTPDTPENRAEFGPWAPRTTGRHRRRCGCSR